MLESWENLFNCALDQHCPWRNKRVALASQTPWMSNAIINQLRLRDTLLKRSKRSNNPDDWAEYKKARNKAVGMLKSAKRKYYVSKLENNKNNAKEMWKTIKSISGSNKQSKRVNKLKADGRILEDKEQIASEFNSHFTSIADQLRSLLPQMNFDISKLRNYVSSRKDASNTFSIPPITESKIIDCLKNISSNKASGIDNISARMLKLAAPIIAPSIAKLINCSFDTSVFPQRWKTAKVTPLFKGGDTESVNNYRPISVLPVLSKVIERHVHDSLYGYLMDNNLIYSKQSGFRKRHSTETALIGIIDELLFNLDNDRVSGMILIDYCKAFDMVDHSILLQKLQAYGLDDKSINWFRSYLNERLQLVSMGNKESPTACVRHGVPQGSILGALLFIAFINDLPLHVSSAQIDLYADDTTVTSTANYGSVDFLLSSLTTAISEVDQWATANKLPLNESKTKVLTVTGKRLSTRISQDLAIAVNGKQLENVQCAKLLGLEIDHELTFIPHVDKICIKLSQRIGILKRIKCCLPLKHRLLYYNTMIRPIIDYVSVVWTSCDKHTLARVLKLQKRAARVILDADRQANSVKLFNRLNWIPFTEQAKLSNHFLAIFSKLQEFVQNSVFSPISPPFVIIRQEKPLFSHFQQSAGVCTEQRFQSDISTVFVIIRLEKPLFSHFQQSAGVCTKQNGAGV
ncbi:hypothetical protein ACROYT_G035530 [Oculina patagonica]